MNDVERDGIWHIVARTEDTEAVTVCDLRIVQQTYLWERQPSPVCSRCKAGLWGYPAAMAATERCSLGTWLAPTGAASVG